MRTSRKIVALTIGLIIGVTAIAITINQVNGTAPQPVFEETPILSVSTTTMQLTTLAEKVFANGNIMAWQEAIIGTEVNGLKLEKVHVNVGDEVKKGQLIASFAAHTLQAELAKSKAVSQEAQAALEEAEADRLRAISLDTEKALSKQSIQQYISAEKIARARLNAAIASQELIKLHISQAQVVAPDDGIISSRSATVGAVLGVGDELFRLLRGGRIEWRAEVFASDLEKLKPGQVATLYNTEQKELAGKIRKISPIVDTQTRNGLVYVDINQSSAFRAGMFVQGHFTISQSQVATLPLSAVQLIDGFSYVMRVDQDSRVRRTKVHLGKRSKEQVEIVSGINHADEVVITGGSFIADGDLVRVIPKPVSNDNEGSV